MILTEQFYEICVRSAQLNIVELKINKTILKEVGTSLCA